MPHSHDGHAPSALPKRYRPLYERLRRGQWRRDELEWLLAHDSGLPPLIRWVIQQQLDTGQDTR